MTFLRWAFLAAVFAFGFAESAEAQWGPDFGGPGGQYFYDTCSSNQHFGRAYVRAASWVDGIQVGCRTNTNQAVTFTWKPWHGGYGGSWYDLNCGKYMTGVTTWWGTFVNAISFQCFAHLRGGTRADYTATVGGRVGTFQGYYCATGKAIVAYDGGAATYLDRIATYCATRGPD